jgi:hypothetical protein
VTRYIVLPATLPTESGSLELPSVVVQLYEGSAAARMTIANIAQCYSARIRVGWWVRVWFLKGLVQWQHVYAHVTLDKAVS